MTSLVTWKCLNGDAVKMFSQLEPESVQCCVTSPPYYGLRDYGVDGQIGLESTPTEYVNRIVEVFREVRRILKVDGTLWLNLGDSYAGSGKGGNPEDSPHQKQRTNSGSLTVIGNTAREAARTRGPGDDRLFGYKPKDLIGIPWRVAFALQSDGWFLRQDIIWDKPNPMPESVRDRCTKSHEYVFLLSKSERYYFDADAIAEKAASVGGGHSFGKQRHDATGTGQQSRTYERPVYEKRNARSVWRIATKSYSGAHFAVMPESLALRCIKAGSREGDTILDPFAGSGTTLKVAIEMGRNAVGIELNHEYVNGPMAERMAGVGEDLFQSVQ